MNEKPKMHLFVGTQADTAGHGIYGLWLDGTTGRLSPAHPAAEIERPTWVCRHPQLPVLYAVSEVGNRDARDGRLYSLHINDEGALTPLNDISARGGGPTDLALDADGTTLFVANFGGGQVLAIPVREDGGLADTISQCVHVGSGPHKRQTKPHPHGVTIDPTGMFLLAPDMGSDRVYVHRFDSVSRTLECALSREVELPPGSGPRLLRFAGGGRCAYMLSELSAELYAFAWNPGQASLELIQTVALDPPDAAGEPSAAALVVSDDGRHLYVSNRRTHSVQAYDIDAESGILTAIQAIASGGERPWAATLAPGGDWLLVANQASDTVVVFRVDRNSGELRPVEGGEATVPTPTCIAFSGIGR